jgi:hypothetical protein
MGVRNGTKESIGRLAAKTIDAKFPHEIEHGLNCSPFEAEAVLEVAYHLDELLRLGCGGGERNGLVQICPFWGGNADGVGRSKACEDLPLC